MRIFCLLRAILKSTFLEKKNFSEKHDFEKKIFCKSHDFEIKFFHLAKLGINFFYNASDFELKISRRVTFSRKNIFSESMTLKKKFFLKSTILKKKINFKSRFWKKCCTQKTTFWFYLPRKMLVFCVLRAILKCRILKKKNFLKDTILMKK